MEEDTDIIMTTASGDNSDMVNGKDLNPQLNSLPHSVIAHGWIPFMVSRFDNIFQ